MMDDRRRKLGRFGIGGRVASVAAIATLAVSPVVASEAGSILDGVVLAIAETVFGVPVSAQDCTDRNGDPRECTATEEYGRCLVNAADALDQCLDGAPWWVALGCNVLSAVDGVACATGLIGDVVLPLG